MLSMRYWEEIDQSKTNEIGEFSFVINLKGDYKLEWNIEGNETSEKEYVKDFEGRKYIKIVHQNRFGRTPIWDR